MADWTAEECVGFGLAAVMARRGVDHAAIAAALGVALPDPACSSGDDALALIGTGPGTWLACRRSAAPGWAAGLGEPLARLASVSDQSSGYLLFRLAGAGARAALQRGLALDLDPASFRPVAVAVSVIAHFGVILRQLDDTPAYEIAIPRSFGGSFRHWLELQQPAGAR